MHWTVTGIIISSAVVKRKDKTGNETVYSYGNELCGMQCTC